MIDQPHPKPKEGKDGINHLVCYGYFFYGKDNGGNSQDVEKKLKRKDGLIVVTEYL